MLPDHILDFTFEGELLFCSLMNTYSYIPKVHNYTYIKFSGKEFLGLKWVIIKMGNGYYITTQLSTTSIIA